MEAFRDLEEDLLPPLSAEDYNFVREKNCSNGSQVDPQKVQKWCTKFGVKPPTQIAKNLGSTLKNHLATAAVRMASSENRKASPHHRATSKTNQSSSVSEPGVLQLCPQILINAEK
jgi:hypothetical protein